MERSFIRTRENCLTAQLKGHLKFTRCVHIDVAKSILCITLTTGFLTFFVPEDILVLSLSNFGLYYGFLIYTGCLKKMYTLFESL